jgi:diguanylate cyclase (GGDEF)-like protein
MVDSAGFVMVLFAIAALMLFFSAYATAKRRVRAAPEFACLMGASAIYALGYGFELTKTTAEAMLGAIRFEYFGIAPLPAFWLLFALALAGDGRLRRRGAAALFILPLVTLVAVWTNDFHHLYYASTWARSDGPFPVLAFERGPLYWLNFLYLQLCILVGNVTFIIYALRSSRFVRRQAVISAVGSLGPWVGNICYQAGWIPWGLDPSPFFLVFSGICFSLSLFYFGFFELVPEARDRAIESLHDGFLVVDDRERVIDANEAAGRLLGDWARLKGESLESGGPGSAEIRGVIARGQAEIEFGLPAPDGGERRLVALSFPVRRGRRSKKGGSGVMIRDVTENAALLARLGQLAGTDELTGLFNRRRFFEYASRDFSIAVREGRSLAVAILDIDHFKSVNDRFGHAVGDVVLRVFASRLTAALREADILCRYGGEEFALLFPGAEPRAALVAIERMRLAAVEGAIAWEGGELAIQASAGVYSAVPRRDSSLDVFLEEADRALYEAKGSGRDRSVLRG